MTREEKIKQLLATKQDAIKLKKASLKFSNAFDFKADKKITAKASTVSDHEGVLNRNIIANTYYWMDSHDDVHVKGCFTKTIQEVTPFFLADHEFEVRAKIGEILTSEEKVVNWSDLGINKEGSTICLVHNVDIIQKYNEGVYAQYERGSIDQHSVGMMYVKVDLAIDDITDKEAYALFHQVLPLLGNPEKAIANGYFFVVSEAKLRETSAVLKGSNSLTGVMDTEKTEDAIKKLIEKGVSIEEIYNICKSIEDTNKVDEPLIDTHKTEKPSYFIQMLKY